MNRLRRAAGAATVKGASHRSENIVAVPFLVEQLRGPWFGVMVSRTIMRRDRRARGHHSKTARGVISGACSRDCVRGAEMERAVRAVSRGETARHRVKIVTPEYETTGNSQLILQ